LIHHVANATTLPSGVCILMNQTELDSNN